MVGHKPNPSIGQRVIFVDTDGESHRAVIVDDVPGDPYVTLIWGGDQGELGDGYHSRVETETSVFPHAHAFDVEGATTTCAYLPIHWQYEDEYGEGYDG